MLYSKLFIAVYVPGLTVRQLHVRRRFHIMVHVLRSAYQVRKKAGAFTEAVGHTRRVGGKVVVHPDVEGGEPPVRLVDEVLHVKKT